jgi:hypothetical protein
MHRMRRGGAVIHTRRISTCGRWLMARRSLHPPQTAHLSVRSQKLQLEVTIPRTTTVGVFARGVSASGK